MTTKDEHARHREREALAHRIAARTLELGDPYTAALEVLRETNYLSPPLPPASKLRVVKQHPGTAQPPC